MESIAIMRYLNFLSSSVFLTQLLTRVSEYFPDVKAGGVMGGGVMRGGCNGRGA